MVILFLYIYCIGGNGEASHVYELLKDFVIPIITGLGVPLLVFLLTMGNENYKAHYSRFKFREFFYFKLRSVKKDAQDAVNNFTEAIKTVGFDHPIYKLTHLPSTNARTLRDIPFLDIVDSFHNEFSAVQDFEINMSKLTSCLDFVADIPKHATNFLLNYNDTVIAATNDTTILFRDVNNYVARKLLEMGAMSEELRNYWTDIDKSVDTFRIHGGSTNSQDLAFFENLRTTVVSAKIKIVDQMFLSIVDKIIDNYQNIEDSSSELKSQFNNYLDAYNDLLRNIDIILPSIRLTHPRRTDFRNYF